MRISTLWVKSGGALAIVTGTRSSATFSDGLAITAAPLHGGLWRSYADHRMATGVREHLVTPDGTIHLVEELGLQMRRLFGRSLRLRSVAAGSCNGCESELVALGNVVFDMARFGIQFVASPRHADGIVISGAVSRNMASAVYRTYDAIAEPRLVIAVGACAINGGPFLDSPEAHNGVEGLLRLYLDLWHAFPDALRIAYKAQDRPIGDLGRLHRAFTAGVLRVFGRAREAGILRSGDPMLAGHAMRQVAVPLLELYGARPDGDRLFVEGLRALLLIGPPEEGGAGLSSRRSRGGRGRAS